MQGLRYFWYVVRRVSPMATAYSIARARLLWRELEVSIRDPRTVCRAEQARHTKLFMDILRV